MRLWAEERKSGSVELLMTLPITPWQAVLGKFLAAWAFTGIALALPRVFELPLGCASLVMSLVGLGLALGDEAMFAFALIAVGCTLMFIAAALRHLLLGIAGYAATGIGVSLELAAFGNRK